MYVVGDTSCDIEAAHAGNATAIGLATGRYRTRVAGCEGRPCVGLSDVR
ncbi:HAD hydrolase-like protein [Streptomyces sp. NRRL S-1022]